MNLVDYLFLDKDLTGDPKHQFVLLRNVTKVAQALECDKRKIKITMCVMDSLMISVTFG